MVIDYIIEKMIFRICKALNQKMGEYDLEIQLTNVTKQKSY